MKKNKYIYTIIGIFVITLSSLIWLSKLWGKNNLVQNEKTVAVSNNKLSPTSDKTYKDPTGAYSLEYSDVFKMNLYDYTWSKYPNLSYSDPSNQSNTKIGTYNETSISIRLFDQSETGGLDKTVRQIAEVARADELKVGAFNDEASELVKITISGKSGYTYTTKKGGQINQKEIYLDLGKVVDIKPLGKSKTLWISIQYRGDSDFIDKSRIAVDEVINTLKIN